MLGLAFSEGNFILQGKAQNPMASSCCRRRVQEVAAFGRYGRWGPLAPTATGPETLTGLVKVQCVVLAQLERYALAKGLGELNGLLQGQLEGALAEGGAIEFVE